LLGWKGHKQRFADFFQYFQHESNGTQRQNKRLQTS